MIYAGELKINLHDGRGTLQCAIINVCSRSPTVLRLLVEGRSPWLALSPWEWPVRGVGLVLPGEVPGLSVLRRSLLPPRVPAGSGACWVSESSSIKQMAANGLFPILQCSNS